jgi:WD40 repeat protein
MGEVLAIKESSANPRQLTSIGADGNILVWSLPEGTGHIVSSLSSPARLATLGTSKALIAWTSGLTINVACVFGCSQRWALTRLKSRSTSLAFHENDTAVLIGGADGRVYRWQFLKESGALTVKEREKILERYIAHQTMISTVLSLHTGRAFFSADWDGVLYGWLAYTADDQQGDYDKNLFGGRFFGNTGNYFRAPRPTDRGITSLALSSDGGHLVVGTDDGAVEVWKVRGFEMVARSSLHNGRVTGVALNSDGSKTLSVGRDGKIVAAHIVKDPLFRIQAASLPSKLEVALTETIPNAKSVSFLSTGDAIVSTSDGHLGEIKLPKDKPPLSEVTPLPKPIGTTSHDSDY